MTVQELKYGKEIIQFDIEEERISQILLAREKEGLNDPLKSVEESLLNPIGTLPLLDLVKKKMPEDVVIIVNDVTRPTPYNYILPPILGTLHQAGLVKEQIKFVIATGVHSPHTEEQNIEIFGEDLVNSYAFHFHNCDQELKYLGKLSSGNDFFVNKEVANADFIITTGVILPHYFAGFSGGRKSILPGVAGRKTIEFNHQRMVELMHNLPPVEKNPVSLEMIEGANKLKVDFIVNVVTNSKREVVKVVAGDLTKAWLAGIDTSAAMYHVLIKEKADVTIVSTGGYPRDINVYQAQKALDHADQATKEGGTIILLSECKEGLGEKVFEQWMFEADKPEDNIERIKKEFVIGGHKAFAICKVAAKKEIILISSLSKETTEKLFAKKLDSVADALDYVKRKYNDKYKAVIMPQGSLTVPILKAK